jgi:hypothetical protein
LLSAAPSCAQLTSAKGNGARRRDGVSTVAAEAGMVMFKAGITASGAVITVVMIAYAVFVGPSLVEVALGEVALGEVALPTCQRDLRRSLWRERPSLSESASSRWLAGRSSARASLMASPRLIQNDH